MKILSNHFMITILISCFVSSAMSMVETPKDATDSAQITPLHNAVFSSDMPTTERFACRGCQYTCPQLFWADSFACCN